MAMYHVDPFGLAWLDLEHSGDVDALGGSQYRRYRAEWERSEIIQPLTPRQWIVSTLQLEDRILRHIYEIEGDS